jgi:colanic acid/amylovoran biosynthesis glycosyltransferase
VTSHENAPLRIAVMTDRFPVLSETFVTNEIRELRRLGHHVRVDAIAHAPTPNWDAAGDVPACFLEDERLLPKLVDAAWLVAAHPLRSLRDLVERRAWRREERVVPLRALARRARRAHSERVEHLHVHFATRSALDAMRIGRLLGIPYSVTVHAFEVFATPANIRVKLERSAFSTSVCEYTLGQMRPLVAPQHAERLALVTMGIDVDGFRRGAPYPGGRTVLAIGRLVEKKGLRYLVDAAARLRERGAVDRVVVVGDGPLWPELEARIAELGIGDVVELLGARAPDEVRDLLESADVLAMPSVIAKDGDRDSMPVAVFEALAMELPVVASDLVGLPEHVRPEWGRLVPPGDADALADAIAAILALPREDRVAMGAAARGWAEEHCNGRIEAARLAGLIRAARTQPLSSSR